MKKKQLEQLLSDLVEKDHEIKRLQKYIDHLADQFMDSRVDNMDLLSRINDLEQECDKLTGERIAAENKCVRFAVSSGEHAAALRIKNYIDHGACINSCNGCIYNNDNCVDMLHNDMLALADGVIRWCDNA